VFLHGRRQIFVETDEIQIGMTIETIEMIGIGIEIEEVESGI
jgi:hypothetical protein